MPPLWGAPAPMGPCFTLLRLHGSCLPPTGGYASIDTSSIYAQPDYKHTAIIVQTYVFSGHKRDGFFTAETSSEAKSGICVSYGSAKKDIRLVFPKTRYTGSVL